MRNWFVAGRETRVDEKEEEARVMVGADAVVAAQGEVGDGDQAVSSAINVFVTGQPGMYDFTLPHLNPFPLTPAFWPLPSFQELRAPGKVYVWSIIIDGWT